MESKTDMTATRISTTHLNSFLIHSWHFPFFPSLFLIVAVSFDTHTYTYTRTHANFILLLIRIRHLLPAYHRKHRLLRDLVLGAHHLR